MVEDHELLEPIGLERTKNNVLVIVGDETGRATGRCPRPVSAPAATGFQALAKAIALSYAALILAQRSLQIACCSAPAATSGCQFFISDLRALLMASMSVVGWSSKTSQKLLICFQPFSPFPILSADLQTFFKPAGRS